jgi:coiled-coil domain-containing protein 61
LEVPCLTTAKSKTTFTSAEIQEITTKTGNFKKLPVFIKMLRAALRQDSDTVFVDLLTYADLEALKARRSGGADTPLASSIPPNNKRYLILTYAAEFDRVHYPLPLAFDEAPDPEHLRRIISKLREELDQACPWSLNTNDPSNKPTVGIDHDDF